MGNCLVMQEKVIKIMRTDGKILEYKAPMKVHQLLSEFPGHAISDALPVLRHLRPDTDMLGGHLYFLLPLPLQLPGVHKKMVRFSNPEVEAGQETGVVRIKLVISKQELRKMLRKEGVSVDEMVSQLENSQIANKVDKCDGDDDGNENCRGWKPALESIPEVN